MQSAPTIKPSHRAIKKYYETLGRMHAQDVSHESAVRSAFQNLLADLAKSRNWDLIPELGGKHQGNRVVPDGTVRDLSYLVRGHWEAKDTKDKLEIEIAKKIARGYPIQNIIFEDTKTGVLYQDGAEVQRANLGAPQELADLLNRFFAHSEPDIEKFEKAVDEFRARVPELAQGLIKKIEEAHKTNKNFQAAFDDFFRLCQHSLNPNISRDAVNEMLVQHLLTERLIRTIFDDPDFSHRNVIAAEVEKVMAALFSKSLNRAAYLKSLDRFYIAIEDAARGLSDFSDKQHFLNTVYERFFQGFSVKVADTHGIVYTPQAIVDFMCASVAEVLEKEFGKTLGSKDVNILDPCTGTGNFIVNILRRIPKRDVEHMYKNQLFANEVMLLPYYIAALNIEHAYYEITGEYEAFEGLCFVDTLDMAEHPQAEFEFMIPANTERVKRQKNAQITVIIGNPPYNVGQLSENDNNKNREYPVIEKRVKQTYAADSTATNKNALKDVYVKFFRWALDRLEGRDGIICYVSNNSFVDQLAFDGMRKHLAEDFTLLYHVDLHGNVRKNPKLSGTTHNVFGIKLGVGITVAVRRKAARTRAILYHRVPEMWRKQEKLTWLNEREHVYAKTASTKAGWRAITPSSNYTWLVPKHVDTFAKHFPIGSRNAKAANDANAQCIFKEYSRGVATSRDDVVYDFNKHSLLLRVKQFVEDYNTEVDRWKRAKDKSAIDNFVNYDRIKWSRDLKLDLKRGHYAEFDSDRLHKGKYRPFTGRFLYFDRILNEEIYSLHHIFPRHSTTSSECNHLIAITDAGSEKPFMVLATINVPDLHLVGAGASCQCFPYYVYDEDGSNRRDNITDSALKKFREHYADKKITKWDIFYYVYGILHHPGYRTKYADNLKRELPRVPFAPDFRAFAKAGKELEHWHLDYEDIKPYDLKFIETKGVPLSYHVDDQMRLTKDKRGLIVNKSLTLTGIPEKCYDYRLGNRSALEWVIDQYQLKTDPRTNITSDPNREDDPEYIVRLVGQVIKVSLETVKIVEAFPDNFGG